MFNSFLFNSNEFNTTTSILEDIVVSLIVNRSISLTAASNLMALTTNDLSNSEGADNLGSIGLTAGVEPLSLSTTSETVIL